MTKTRGFEARQNPGAFFFLTHQKVERHFSLLVHLPQCKSKTVQIAHLESTLPSVKPLSLPSLSSIPPPSLLRPRGFGLVHLRPNLEAATAPEAVAPPRSLPRHPTPPFRSPIRSGAATAVQIEPPAPVGGEAGCASSLSAEPFKRIHFLSRRRRGREPVRGLRS